MLLLFLTAGRAASSAPLPAPEPFISGVPFYPQEDFGCGPAAVASVLTYWNRPVSLEEITREVYLEQLKGSLPMDLVQAVLKRGLSAIPYAGSLENLRGHLSRNQPVIAFLNLRSRLFPQGHFVVVTGFDESLSTVIAHSGEDAYKRIPADDFLKAWARTGHWSLLVLPMEESS